MRKRKTECGRGHVYVAGSFHWRPDGSRDCYECRRLRMVRYAADKPPPPRVTKKTACRNGHPFAETEFYWTSHGTRGCRECKRIRDRAYQAKQRARLKEISRELRGAA